MSADEWLALNGGKLLGTDILPPQTDEEIAAWIAERKKRFPSARRTKEKALEDSELKKKSQAREERWRKKEDERKQKEVEERKKGAQERAEKRKREDGGSGSDSAPEEVSARTRTVFRDDRKKNETRTRPEKRCKQFSLNGSCPRGEECKFRHDKKGNKKQQPQQSKDEKKKPSLYQMVCFGFLDGIGLC